MKYRVGMEHGVREKADSQGAVALKQKKSAGNNKNNRDPGIKETRFEKVERINL